MSATFFDKIQETAEFIKTRIKATPKFAVVLGSGLGGMAKAVIVSEELSYTEIPNFPQSTVEGHDGKLIFGTIGEKQVMMMSGRFHYYEGYSMQEVTFPMRVMAALGVEVMICSNAAGGMNPDFKIGEIMFIRDHINLFPEHPLRGKNDERLGTRFPDMSEPYNLEFLKKAKEIAFNANIEVKEGVYIGLQGPTFETRAEYKWLSIIGGDAVGMSTVPEIIVANHAGMKVFAASIITDLGIRDEMNTITHAEVLEAANAAAPKLEKIVTELIKSI